MQVTNVSSSSVYNLTVHVPEVPPFNHTISFTVNINVPTTITSVFSSTTVVADGDVIPIIIAVVVVVVIITALVVVIIILYRKLQQKQSLASSSRTSMKHQGNLRIILKE